MGEISTSGEKQVEKVVCFPSLTSIRNSNVCAQQDIVDTLFSCFPLSNVDSTQFDWYTTNCIDNIFKLVA